MRPARFQNLLAAAVNADGKLTAATYENTGITTSRWGLIIQGPVHASVQIVARSADGDDYGQPETIVTGTPHPSLPVLAMMPLRKDAVERYLAALIIDIAPDEVRSVHLYSDRDKPGAIKHGATFAFHDGSKIFLYVHDE